MTYGYLGFNAPELYECNPEQRTALCAGIAKSGATGVRVLAPWGQAKIFGLFPHPTQKGICAAGPTARDWATMDAVIASVTGAGLEPLICIGAPWPATWKGTVESFAALTGDIAARYRGWPIEVFNEQNSRKYWEGGPSAQAYAKYLAAAYDAIKAVSAETLVVFGGMMACGTGLKLGKLVLVNQTVDQLEFVTTAWDAGAAHKFDVMGFHPYPLDDGFRLEMPGSTQLQMRKSDAVHEFLVGKGVQCPIWWTEIGADSARISEAEQAEDLRTLLDCRRFRPEVERVYVHGYQDWPRVNRSATNPEHNYGLVHADGTAKPALAVVKALR